MDVYLAARGEAMSGIIIGLVIFLLYVGLRRIDHMLERIARAIESNHDQCWVNKKPEGGVGYGEGKEPS